MIRETNSENDKNRTRTIDDYPSAAFNNDPFLYPGMRPNTSYLLDNGSIYEVGTSGEASEFVFTIESASGISETLDDYLTRRGVARMGERIPVLAYGANMSPSSLHKKFDRIGREDAYIIPTLYGQLDGYDVVWSGGPGWKGNFIANLYKGVETEGTSIQVGVNFLTPEQLLVLHSTEMSYDLTQVEVDINSVKVRAVTYAGIDHILIEDGKPVAVGSVIAQPGTRQLRAADTRELVDEFVRLPVMQELFSTQGYGVITSAEDYVANTAELEAIKGARMARKREVHAALAASGYSKDYVLPIDPSALQSWSNPSTIPTYGEQLQGVHHKNLYVLPTTELPKEKWADSGKREAVLRALTKHHLNMTGLKETPKDA